MIRKLKHNKPLYPKPHTLCPTSGFTLIEVMVGMVVLVAVIGAVVGVQILLKQSYGFTLNTTLTVDHANGVVQQMERVVRNGRTDDNGAFVLDGINDQELVIYSDTDGDAQTEKVRYFLDGANLKRGVIQPNGFPVLYPEENEVVTILSEYVRNGSEPLFYYYNGEYPTDVVNNPLPLSQRLQNTRFIEMRVKVNADTARPEGDYLLTGFAQVRNLKDNL